MKLTYSRHYLIHSPRELNFQQNPKVYFYQYAFWYSKTLKLFTYDVTLNVPCTTKLIEDMIIGFNDDIRIFMVRKVRIYGD